MAMGSGSSPEQLAMALAAYFLTDLATDVYHLFVENYEDASTPLFGAQVTVFWDR